MSDIALKNKILSQALRGEKGIPFLNEALMAVLMIPYREIKDPFTPHVGAFRDGGYNKALDDVHAAIANALGIRKEIDEYDIDGLKIKLCTDETLGPDEWRLE